MTLGQRIQELRKQKGLSQEALGEVLSVSRQAVSKWEGDNGIPELDTLIAMSRLFGVTIGELLGVEEGKPQPEQMPAQEDEQRVEEILQRYAQQIKADTASAKKLRQEWMIVILLVSVTVVAVLSGQIRSLRATVRQLRGQVSSLEVQVSNELSGLSGQIRNSIYDVLAEQDRLLNTFSWEVVKMDPASEMVVIRFCATMKEYQPGSSMQFRLEWVESNESSGSVESEWVEGPDFIGEVTVPMNYHTEVSLRVQDTQGGIREQFWDTIYALHPENFQLNAYSLMAPFALTMRANGVTSVTTRGEAPHAEIYTLYPQMIWPEKAVITASVNGQTVFTEEMIVEEADEDGLFPATVSNGYFALELVADDELLVQMEVTDNLGRTTSFVDGGKVICQRGEAPELERMPIAAPVVGY